jgi:hypothetical protein
MAKQWQLHNIILTPTVLSATAVIPNVLTQSFAKLDLPLHVMFQARKAGTLNTCSMKRKSLIGEHNLPDDEFVNY